MIKLTSLLLNKYEKSSQLHSRIHLYAPGKPTKFSNILQHREN